MGDEEAEDELDDIGVVDVGGRVDDGEAEGELDETEVDDNGVVEIGDVADDDGGVDEGALVETAVAPRDTPDANDVCFAPSPFKGLKPP